jgi:hypothetical protein
MNIKKLVLFLIILIITCKYDDKIDIPKEIEATIKYIPMETSRHYLYINEFKNRIDYKTFISFIINISNSLKPIRYKLNYTYENKNYKYKKYDIINNNKYDCIKLNYYNFNQKSLNNKFNLNEYNFINEKNKIILKIILVNNEIRSIKLENQEYNNCFIDYPNGYDEFIDNYQKIKDEKKL